MVGLNPNFRRQNNRSYRGSLYRSIMCIGVYEMSIPKIHSSTMICLPQAPMVILVRPPKAPCDFQFQAPQWFSFMPHAVSL